MARETKRLLIEGVVQGVGYRYSFVSAANRLGLCGWVRNRRDGAVEAVVQGDAEAVKEIVTWAHRGPSSAHVDHVDVSETSGDFASFEIRDTI